MFYFFALVYTLLMPLLAYGLAYGSGGHPIDIIIRTGFLTVIGWLYILIMVSFGYESPNPLSRLDARISRFIRSALSYVRRAGQAVALALFAFLFVFTPSAHAAIALDNANAWDGGLNISGNYTEAYTNTAGTAMVLSVWTQTGTAYVPPSSVTWNGTNLVMKCEEHGNNGQFLDVSEWALASPATGSHTIQVNLTGTSVRNALQAVTLTGTNTVSPFGATNGNTSGTSPSTGSVAVTTTQANSWIVYGINSDGASMTTTGTNQTDRASVTTSGGYPNSISTQTTTTVGSYSGTWSFTGATSYTACGLEVKTPAVATPTSVILNLLRARWY